MAARLRAAGHDVYPITLTGLGERSHLARPEIDLETHIADVVNVMAWEDLRDVVLVGHSYAGIVITGVADRVPERLRALVFVDSAPFADGMAYVDISPPEGLAALRATVAVEGEGWRLPFPGIGGLAENASIAGLREAQQRLMTAKATAQPWGTYTQPLRLARPQGTALGYEEVAIACDDMRGLVAAGVPQIVALTAPPWRYLELETGHWPMLSAPAALAEMLEGFAAET